MAKGKKSGEQSDDNVVDYRYKNVTRLNIPPAGLAARGEIIKEKKVKYAYNPHLTPALRFDASGKTDTTEKIMEEASHRILTADEIKLLKESFRNHEPWLEWAGKREQQWCVADPVALHIHERISTQAILRVAKREDIQRNLFADPEQEYREAVQFYRHPMDWTNRLILGDSLAIMASLARREALAGKVQMIYMDPPYGIKYSSNFQPEVGRRDVKDRDEDLTREPEMVKAYRDTWTLGVHSYLSYLRDRLLLCKELLADTGSIFVQISDENMHRVRTVLDEVFGAYNEVATIAYKKAAPETKTIKNGFNYLLWYTKDIERAKTRKLLRQRRISEGTTEDPKKLALWLKDPTGFERPLTTDEKREEEEIEQGTEVFRVDKVRDAGSNPDKIFEIAFQGEKLLPGNDFTWRGYPGEMQRLIGSERILRTKETLGFKLFQTDSGGVEYTSMWEDTAGKIPDMRFVVQTNDKILTRCIMMTTDPGDLVLDPTCGSGTTAYVAEQWGRRWITIDVSRVALAIARQRLLTAKFDYYKLRPTSAKDVQLNPDGLWLTDPDGNIQGTCTFDCKTVPHITLKSIAQNQALDPIFEKWEPILTEKPKNLNQVLAKTVTSNLRQSLLYKLQHKIKTEGKKSVTDADERRWKLPEKEWKEWEVPFDTDPDWPDDLKKALTDYRQAWRQKMDEVNACIAARADQEELVDQPYIDRGRVRVAGPFTVEGVIPAEESIDYTEAEESPIIGAPEELATFGQSQSPVESESQNSEAYLDRMIRLLREDGVRFPNNKILKFNTLEALADGSILHAKGTWGEDSDERLVAIMFGPQYGPLTTNMVEDAIRTAARRGFDDLVFAGFSFTGEAQVTIQEVQDPDLKLHMAQIRPDVNMGDLLKTTVSSQLFTVSGSPRTRVEKQKDGQYVMHMEGVDIYDPVTNSVRSTGAEKVAAWFLDSDYDGRCFCVCQAFFPDKNAWEKLGKALGTRLDADALARLSGTVSLPFPVGPHKRIAIKVIDPRGNEVMRVHRMGGEYD